jgi:Fe-S-cluster-containing dehydrogenase component
MGWNRMRKGFFIDHDLCIVCDACTGACMSWNNLEDGVFWIRAVTTEKGMYPNPVVNNIVVVCRHCADPPCLKACPEEAIYRREKDGIVTVFRMPYLP